MENVINRYFDQINRLLSPFSCLVVDNRSAELFHWNHDFNEICADKALAVKDFSSFSQVPRHVKSLVIVINDVVSEKTYPVVLDLLKSASSVEQCDVVTPYSENFHASLQENHTLKIESFHAMSTQLRRGSKMNISVNFHHIPLQNVFVDEQLGLFINTSIADLFDIQLADYTRNKDQGAMSALEALPSSAQTGIKKFCGNIWRLMSDLDAEIVAFSVGKLSRFVAEHLATIPAPKSASEKFSIVFVDRAFDLVSAFQHSEKCFADILFKKFEPFNDVGSDLKIPVNELMLKHIRIPGCLSNPQNATHQTLFRKLFTGKKKELQNASFRVLTEICSRENVQFGEKLTKASFENVEKVLTVLEQRENRKVLHDNLSVVCLTVAIWLASNDVQFDEKLKLHKAFLQSFSNRVLDAKAVCEALISVLEQNNIDSLTSEEIISFVLSCFSMCSAKSNVSEKSAKRLFSLIKTKSFSKHGDENEESLSCRLLKSEQVFISGISKVVRCRNEMTDYLSLFDIEDTVPRYCPILERISEDIFKNDHNQFPTDITCVSSSASIRNLIKSSFSYFMPVSKSRPAENLNLMFFVIGGITATEVKLIRDAALKYNYSGKLFIGSNKIIGHHRYILESIAKAF